MHITQVYVLQHMTSFTKAARPNEVGSYLSYPRHMPRLDNVVQGVLLPPHGHVHMILIALQEMQVQLTMPWMQCL